VIGTEVPVPGGTRGADEAPAPTRVVDMESTLDLTRRAFLARGLEAAWRRVIALVVQPGVEFGDHRVHPYERAKALPLSKALARHPGLVFEGHSTDYQHPSRLREMAADGIAIQKVGPALTFAFREAVFLLSRIEEELVAITAGGRPAHVPEVLERTMLAKPAHWAGYYRGSGPALSLELRYSFSDRCRYYWSEPELRVALPALLDNLGAADIPDALLSQYLPNQYWRIRDGSLSRLPAELIKDRIKDVLRSYPQYAPAIRDHAAAA
jgi:D-tagatose-1,6-bisphosphate aldolase subunit GatZ/KbaZ